MTVLRFVPAAAAEAPPRRASSVQGDATLRSRLRLTRRRVVLGLALLLVVAVQAVNINNWPLFFDDEGTYVAEAWAVYQRGELAHYTYWYDHPPAGWLQLAAFFAPLKLLGVESSVPVGRYVMVLYAVATAALIFRLCRNLGLRFPTAVAGMLLWGLCPLVIFESRQVMLDNMATTWLLAALVLATSRRRLLWEHLLAGIFFGVAILTKETTVLLAPALLFTLWRSAYQPTRWFSVTASVVTSMLVVSIYPLFGLLKSELVSGPGHVSIQDAILFQLVGRTGSGSITDPTSVAYDTLRSWLFYDKILLVSAVTAGVVCLLLRHLRPVGVALVILAVVALRPGGYLPLMYCIAVLPFAAVALAGVAEWLLLQLSRFRLRGVGVGRVLAGILALAAVAYVGTTWTAKNADALTDRPNDPYYAALNYVKANVDHSAPILVDDAYWNPLVDAGWSSDGWHGAIWYFKLDLDPVAREQPLPQGWKDVDYMLVNDVMVQNFDGLSKLPQLAEAYKHSHVLKEWGSGQTRVQLRQINERMQPFQTIGEASRARVGAPVVLAKEPAPAAVPVRNLQSFSNGQWTVGKEITPGRYRTTSTSKKCYWAEYKDGKRKTTNASQYGKQGKITVTITSADQAFLTTQCGTWKKL